MLPEFRGAAAGGCAWAAGQHRPLDQLHALAAGLGSGARPCCASAAQRAAPPTESGVQVGHRAVGSRPIPTTPLTHNNRNPPTETIATRRRKRSHDVADMAVRLACNTDGIRERVEAAVLEAGAEQTETAQAARAFNLAMSETPTLRELLIAMAEELGCAETARFVETEDAAATTFLPSVERGPIDISKAQHVLGGSDFLHARGQLNFLVFSLDSAPTFGWTRLAANAAAGGAASLAAVLRAGAAGGIANSHDGGGRVSA